MVELWRLRRMSLEELNSRDAELCLKKLDAPLSSDEQLEYVLIGRLMRQHKVKAAA